MNKRTLFIFTNRGLEMLELLSEKSDVEIHYIETVEDLIEEFPDKREFENYGKEFERIIFLHTSLEDKTSVRPYIDRGLVLGINEEPVHSTINNVWGCTEAIRLSKEGKL